MSSAKTIRLQNKTGGNLSFHIHQLKPHSSGSLRRGQMLTNVNIVVGEYYDVCAKLGVSFEDAQRICKGSPDVQHFKAKNYLEEIIFPPEPVAAPVVTPVPAAPAPVSTVEAAPVIFVNVQEKKDIIATMAPAQSAETAPAPVGTVAYFEGQIARGEDGQPVIVEPPVAPAPSATPELETQPPAPEAPEVLDELPQLPEDPDQPPMAPSPTAKQGPAPRLIREPSMDWPEDELRAYAIKRGIDISKAKSKTGVIQAIRAKK